MPQTEMKSSAPTSMVTAASSPDVINKAAAKLCHIVKRPDFDGYGFNLHSEKAKPGQFIGKVDANSPAEAAGLKEGDRILEVNGVAINSETHKQVVQRIKAIACEVRLLLIDVEGKGDAFMFNGQQSSNGEVMETSKTEQVLPGASENINSITMVSTKRPSQESQRMSTQNNNNNSNNNNGLDVTDKAVSAASDHHQLMNMNMNMNMNNNNVPPPPSTTMASASMKTMMNNNINSGSSNHMPTLTTTATTATTSNGSLTEMAAGSGSAGSGNGSGTIRAGSLYLPMTAAEMRAKLMMKKKYDPKNESVDLKKKYEIVQKL